MQASEGAAPGGFKVLDANGQALAYVYARETREQADIAKVLTFDEARRANSAFTLECCTRATVVAGGKCCLGEP
jgi:hypothetical protein